MSTPSKTAAPVALITGGANGIGRCMVETFLNAGWQVEVLDRDQKAGAILTKKWKAKPFWFSAGDAAEQKDLDVFLQGVFRRHRKIHALINNACEMKGGLPDGSYEDFMYVQRLGVASAYYLTLQLLPRFANGASIVNISSTRARQSQPGTESYSAAKGGISALTHAMAASLAGKARVNAILPGWIETAPWQTGKETKPQHSAADKAQHAAGRVGTPQDIADLALYLCGDKAGFITGQEFVVDGGMSALMIYHGDNGWTLKPEKAEE